MIKSPNITKESKTKKPKIIISECVNYKDFNADYHKGFFLAQKYMTARLKFAEDYCRKHYPGFELDMGFIEAKSITAVYVSPDNLETVKNIQDAMQKNENDCWNARSQKMKGNKRKGGR